jgi:hypothetical protein
MRAFVTGSTGLLGINLVRILLRPAMRYGHWPGRKKKRSERLETW